MKSSHHCSSLHFDFSLSCIGEGNGNPLQCSCLENPRDRGAWWAAFYAVTQSRTRLKRLSSSSSISPQTLTLAGAFSWRTRNPWISYPLLITWTHSSQKCPGGRGKQQGSHRPDGGQEPNVKSRLGGVLGRQKSYFREKVGMAERPEHNIKVVKVVVVKRKNRALWDEVLDL